MANKGFIQNPLANINLLRDTLRDRYQSGFPIVKELVQNSDDAGASLLRFVWTEGLATAQHPLLRGPALVVINDGPASEDDLNAIRHMGINYKAASSASIGKFGLGLKSIFHLCEAFFYIAPSENSGEHSQSCFRADILNPWSGAEDLGSHGDWDEFSVECQAAVVQHTKEFLPESDWFLLWIPLRQRHQCFDGDQECDPIVGEFFDECTPIEVLPATIVHQLVPVLPLLKHLSLVEAWTCGNNSAPTKLFQVRLATDFSQRCFPELMAPGERRRVGGKLCMADSSSKEQSCLARGWEVYLDSTALTTLKSHNGWPRSASLYSTRGIAEKSEPHAAAYFVRLPATAEGELSIQWSVFLPVGGPLERQPCKGSSDYVLVLHGYYFVDAGRSRLEYFGNSAPLPDAASEQEVRRHWNGLLARDGTLALILPALESFVDEAALTHDETLRFAKSIQTSHFFLEHRNDVCREKQWLFRLDSSHGHWAAIDAHASVHSIPLPPARDLTLPLSVFPGLGDFISDRTVCYRGWPTLRSTDDFEPWSDEDVARLLEGTPKEIFSDEVKVRYLASFLDSFSSESWGPQAYERLARLLSGAFAKFDIKDLQPLQEVIQELVEFLPAECRLNLSVVTSPIGRALFRELSQLELQTVFIPNDFEPESASAGVLNREDGVTVLQWLAVARPNQTQARELDDIRSRIALQIIDYSADRDSVLQENSDLLLFVANDGKSQSMEPVSFETLQRCFTRGTLFEGPRDGLVDTLQAALANERVMVVVHEMARVLFPNSELSECTWRGCVNALTRRPQLAVPSERKNLLQELISTSGYNPLDGSIKCLRYLLHGEASQFDYDRPLFAGDPAPLNESTP